MVAAERGDRECRPGDRCWMAARCGATRPQRSTEQGMNERDDIRWDLYPHVAGAPDARAFLVRLRQFGRRPKTIDAYARNLDRFLASFGEAPGERWVEAD